MSASASTAPSSHGEAGHGHGHGHAGLAALVVGAVGVGGAPSGTIDEKCATDAVATVLGR